MSCIPITFLGSDLQVVYLAPSLEDCTGENALCMPSGCHFHHFKSGKGSSVNKSVNRIFALVFIVLPDTAMSTFKKFTKSYAVTYVFILSSRNPI